MPFLVQKGLNILHQIIEECVKILIKVIHHNRINNDCIAINDIEFGLLISVIVFQDESVWFQDGHSVYQVRMGSQGLTQYRCGLFKEVITLFVYPLFNDTTGDFLIIVIKRHEFPRVLRNTDMNISEDSSLMT